MYKTVQECRCCGNEHLFKYLDLGDQPLANSYHKGEKIEVFPLHVMLCEKCFHSQLSIAVEPSMMFKNYLYVSGTTQTFRNHCKNLAQDAVEYLGKKNPVVLDIACNDGTLLECFKELNCKVLGVDPAENLREITKNKNIPVEVMYWGHGLLKNCEKLQGKKFDIITGTNVFAHVHDAKKYIEEALLVLDEEGTIVLEFPYCDQMVEHCEFDTIYHEHLSYFLVNSFLSLANQMDLFIDRILRSTIHGGSIRFFLRKNGSHCSDVFGLIEEEKKKGLLSKNTYEKFASKVEKNKSDLAQIFKDLKSQGKKVIGYGASAKGNTMLNYFELDLDYIVDDNSMKWGYLTPGRNIPIKSPEEIKQENDLHIIILAWNFFDEIIQRIEKMCNKKHNYIKYVPEIILN